MSRRGISLGLALVLLVGMAATAALPTAAKHALHTQGRLHLWLHLLGFAALTFLLLSSTRRDLVRVIFIAAVLLFAYATEAFESHRDTWPIETYDVRTDCVGVLLGAVVGLVVFPKNITGRSGERPF